MRQKPSPAKTSTATMAPYLSFLSPHRPIEYPIGGTPSHRPLPIATLKGKPNHIVVMKALIEMVNGLHQTEDRMFGPEAAEWY